MSYPTEIESLIKRAENSLQAAEALHKSGLWDDSASRSYYAAFHAASALLLSENLRYGSHAGVLRAVSLNFVQTDLMAKEYGQNLNLLARLRHIGDYGEVARVTDQQSKQAVTMAKAFIEQAQRLIKNKYSED
ncbi:MAG: HEPN domain-containing protein [Cyanobacteria bacterium J06627_28]